MRDEERKFVDTNLFLYIFIEQDLRKKEITWQIITSKSIVISYQVAYGYASLVAPCYEQKYLIFYYPIIFLELLILEHLKEDYFFRWSVALQSMKKKLSGKDAGMAERQRLPCRKHQEEEFL